ncbi:MAG: DegT/DnrJ/EryC1/StrS aminotransferase family protein [Deltaproteobacteria bacterium]|nr:DegT/DnrJ/EryC1/StrS aminotransferase family protein [Deltaproteobacteria bacterium]MBT4268147.1 DegT/DnrJ/EryC1/StrS aminotransferase family protein [Deltaproteobacteria bacterium]MBT4640224.1 DegT/DnrJ/EryC1/StrS aminotransferase family protein [Deltaproteobacteria bacterium]MBT6614770.1 DegT/DnrJ/EryC1/StrS aminotransferase family protein [Deltaproteobacteria bacterium]MBT7151855.1 DegT/DnrJ/EryC1/StrS aminotransferase family protein [Deltaproteobacteria bacterium]
MKNAFLYETQTKKELAEFIMTASRLSMSDKCQQFEQVFAKTQGRKDCVLFNSGGSANLALIQAYKNLGVLSDGDKIGFSALTWSTNVMPLIQLGLIPVPLDCEPQTLNVMSYNLNDRLQETDLKAVFITNALGLAGDLDKIRELCIKRNILLFEDNCEALGTVLSATKTGNFGDAATFSYFVAHHMSSIEGGSVCTDNQDLAEMLRIVRANGWDRNLTSEQQHKWRNRHEIQGELDDKYTFYDLGFNLRPTEITAFLALTQLRYLEENCLKRERIFKILDAKIRGNDNFLPLNHDHISFLSAFAFPVICKSPQVRDYYIQRLEKENVEVRPVISGNIQRQPFYKKYIKDEYKAPGADMVHDCGFYFGNYPELTDEDLEILSSALMN